MKTKHVFNNAKWIIICKVAQSVIQLLIGMISARYLGPSNYGLINYAASIVAFATPIMRLGMDGILVYELVNSPDQEGEIMGTSLCMNIVSSMLCIVGVSAFAAVMNFNEIQTIVVCILYSTSLFFAAIEMVQYWFQYKLLSKYSSLMMLTAYVVVSLYKVYLLVSAKSVYWFAISHSIEYGLIGILLVILYKRCGGKRLVFSGFRARRMLSSGKHYMFAALMVVIIQNTDHIMLTSMIGKAENGIYSAAITCAGVAQFVYTAIIDSVRPMILASKKENHEAYKQNISRLYCIISYLALANSIVFTLFANIIIKLLYGAEFMAAVPVLQILVWYRAFSFMGIIRNIWLLAEGKQKYLSGINLFGAVLNIAMNSFMIPLWGACGAALASFLTQVVMNFGLGFVFAPIRENNTLLLTGLKPSFVRNEVRSIMSKLRIAGK